MNRSLYQARLANEAAELMPWNREKKLQELFVPGLQTIVSEQLEIIPDVIFDKAKLLQSFFDARSGVSFLEDTSLTDHTFPAHPLFLGRGVTMNVFEHLHDTSKVVKMPRIKDSHTIAGKVRAAAVIDDSLNALLVGSQIPGLEKPFAASYEAGLLVNERMAGKQVDKLTANDIEYITHGQVYEFLETSRNAYALGIGFDPNAQNIFYDIDQGFGVIDYSLQKYPNFSLSKVTDYFVSAVSRRSATHNNPLLKRQVLSVLDDAIDDFRVDAKIDMREPLASIQRHKYS